MSLSPNTTIAQYRIVSKIGAGGMGEVYLAQDTKLDRKVALKILPADVASNQRSDGALRSRSKIGGGSQSSQHRSRFTKLVNTMARTSSRWSLSMAKHCATKIHREQPI